MNTHKSILLACSAVLLQLMITACSLDNGEPAVLAALVNGQSQTMAGDDSSPGEAGIKASSIWDTVTGIFTGTTGTLDIEIAGLFQVPDSGDYQLFNPLLGEALDLVNPDSRALLDEFTQGMGLFGYVLLAAFDKYQYLAMNRNYIYASGTSQPIPRQLKPDVLPGSFVYAGQNFDVEKFLRLTGAGSLIVLKKQQGIDTIIHEQYFNGQTPDSKFESWSVMKSILATLVGMAINEGYIRSVHDYVREYLPYIGPSSAYYNVTILDLLEMASGVLFTEDYADPTSDIIRLQATLSCPLQGFKDHAQGYTEREHDANGNERLPGTFRTYKSIDSQVLGLVLDAAVGSQGLTGFMQDTLWRRAGMTSNAYLLADKDGMPATYSGARITARDYARFGLLYLNGGKAQDGTQVIPSAWVTDSVRADKPHLRVNGDPAYKDDAEDWWGYGRQWWITRTDASYDGQEFMAVGVFNQFVYVNVPDQIVIVKTSANPTYMLSDREYEHLEFFRAIVNKVKNAKAARTISLLGEHGRYFVSEFNGGATVNANRHSIGAWETFTMSTVAPADCIAGGREVSIRTSSDYYWSAQPDGNLDSNRRNLGSWEKFMLINHSAPCGCVKNGDIISLKSTAHNKYMVAERYGAANVNRDAIGAWEKIRLIIH